MIESNDAFSSFEQENQRKTSAMKESEEELDLWRAETIKEMDVDFVNHEQIAKQPLVVNMKQFMMNRNYSDPLSELEGDDFFELQLDDRDLKHILLYLIHNHLNTKRYILECLWLENVFDSKMRIVFQGFMS